ncbi:unnamed protein product [Lactuca saligna]|uniref:Dehydrogenase E1 component domain-containing protein n=1 Tax=Lactuca saligna TaxID=75948 RepID=A0AA35YT14_LACSI|nr:unnamed protein product [Lactuca saligna]
MQFDRQTLSIAMRFLMAKTPEQRAAVDLDTHYTQLRFHSFIPYHMMMMLILSIIQSYIQFEPHPMYLCRNILNNILELKQEDSKGVSARAMMSELFGKKTGCYCGQGRSMHMFSTKHNVLGGLTFIGEGIPVATGASFSSKYRREVLKEADCDHVTLAFFGDGTCNDGQFFECLNMAALWKLPIIFVVENNLWAIGRSYLRLTLDLEI